MVSNKTKRCITYTGLGGILATVGYTIAYYATQAATAIKSIDANNTAADVAAVVGITTLIATPVALRYKRYMKEGTLEDYVIKPDTTKSGIDAIYDDAKEHICKDKEAALYKLLNGPSSTDLVGKEGVFQNAKRCDLKYEVGVVEGDVIILRSYQKGEWAGLTYSKEVTTKYVKLDVDGKFFEVDKAQRDKLVPPKEPEPMVLPQGTPEQLNPPAPQPAPIQQPQTPQQPPQQSDEDFPEGTQAGGPAPTPAPQQQIPPPPPPAQQTPAPRH